MNGVDRVTPEPSCSISLERLSCLSPKHWIGMNEWSESKQSHPFFSFPKSRRSRSLDLISPRQRPFVKKHSHFPHWMNIKGSDVYSLQTMKVSTKKRLNGMAPGSVRIGRSASAKGATRATQCERDMRRQIQVRSLSQIRSAIEAFKGIKAKERKKGKFVSAIDWQRPPPIVQLFCATALCSAVRRGFLFVFLQIPCR